MNERRGGSSPDTTFSRRDVLRGAVVAAALPLISPAERAIAAFSSETSSPIEENDELLLEEVTAKFGSMTTADAITAGYRPTPECVTGEEFDSATPGDMGVHYVNDALLGSFDPLNPYALVFAKDTEKNPLAMAVEWETMIMDPEQKSPEMFGVVFTRMEPHAGMEHQHDALHYWLVDNPNGQFALTHESIQCGDTETSMEHSHSDMQHSGHEVAVPTATPEMKHEHSH